MDELAAESRCAHYWKIDPPTAVESRGVCVRCGTRRTFSNAPPERDDPGAWKPRPG